MGTIMVACIILHNMVVEDEADEVELTNDYLFEDRDRFQVDNVNRDGVASRFQMLVDSRRMYMAEDEHYCLTRDLIEELWFRRTK
jgi:hypothetical protein